MLVPKNFRLMIFPIIVLYISNAYGQNRIEIGAVKTEVGQYYNFLYGHTITENGKHVISGGLKINDAVQYPINFNKISDIYPNSFSEHFGLKLEYQYFFREKNFAVRPYLFAAVEFTKSTARNNFIHVYNTDSIINPNPLNNYLVGREDLEGPYNWFDVRFGIGLEADLSEQFYVNFYAGVGYRKRTGVDSYIDNYYLIYPPNGLSICGGIGLGYKFK